MDLQRRGRTRLNLNAAHIGELVAELAPLVRGARVREVHALPPADLLLVFEPAQSTKMLRLRLSADPNAPRLHLQHARRPLHEGPLGPFFRRVLEELGGATLVRLEQVARDRLVLFEIGDSPAGERRALLGELTGRHANLALLGPADRVIDMLVPAKTGATTVRLAPGKIWSAPSGSGPKLAADALDLRASLPVPLAEAPAAAGLAPLSWIVECALGAQAEAAFDDSERRVLVERVQRKLERARSLLKGLESRESAGQEYERVRADGELLKANLGHMKRGLSTIEVEDFLCEGGGTRRITLDPKRSPHENLERLFDRARKLERSLALVAGEISLARERVGQLTALLEAARTSDDPRELDAGAVERGLLDPRQEGDARKKKESAPRLPYKSFAGLHGAEIRVGKSAKDNDELTFRHARGNDVWLHTADSPGSHVVLVLAGRPEPDSEDLLDAAHLAVHFSPQRAAGRARVHWARRKEVHKPRGAKPGLVTLSGGKTLEVRVQPARLERLLDNRRSATADGSDVPGELS